MYRSTVYRSMYRRSAHPFPVQILVERYQGDDWATVLDRVLPQRKRADYAKGASGPKQGSEHGSERGGPASPETDAAGTCARDSEAQADAAGESAGGGAAAAAGGAAGQEGSILPPATDIVFCKVADVRTEGEGRGTKRRADETG
jgi:hypothetical protein